MEWRGGQRQLRSKVVRPTAAAPLQELVATTPVACFDEIGSMHNDLVEAQKKRCCDFARVSQQVRVRPRFWWTSQVPVAITRCDSTTRNNLLKLTRGSNSPRDSDAVRQLRRHRFATENLGEVALATSRHDAGRKTPLKGLRAPSPWAISNDSPLL